MKRSRIRRKTPLQRGTKRLKRSKLRPVGSRRSRMREEGKLFGDVFDWLMETVGTCQAKDELPGECGVRPNRKTLEPCHALTRNSARYDWTTDPETGETVCNGLLMCPVHHDYADNHKRETLEWMKRVAKSNGVAAIAAGVVLFTRTEGE